jgi:colicin import membrane protein
MSGVAVIELEQKAEVLVTEAKALKIINQQTYDLAAARLLAVADLRREIIDHHAPMKKSTYAAWQHVIGAEKKLLDPVAEAERLYKVSISIYEAEQRRREEESRREAEAEARRQAEEQREREIEEAEGLGATGEEIRAMLNEPLVVPPARVEPVFQQARGVSVAANWKGEVTSLPALVKAVAENKASIGLVMANETAINQLARATRDTLQVPGIRFFSESVVRAGRK